MAQPGGKFDEFAGRYLALLKGEGRASPRRNGRRYQRRKNPTRVGLGCQ